MVHETISTITGVTATINSLWLLIAAGLVFLMTPGVAFFYGGMVSARSVINTMMMSFGAMALVGVLWILYGYGTAFGDPLVAGWLGNPLSQIGLAPLLRIGDDGVMSPDLSELAFAAFQATFAIIAVSLISGSIADRAQFGSWMIFAGAWVTIVYFPVAYWVFNLNDGWASLVLHVNDFAGGCAVHINAGAAALALALVLRKRTKGPDRVREPHNVPFTLLGAALLWFGWFGFNAGSEAAVDGVVALVWINTLAAPAAATLAWLVVEKIKGGKPTSVGAASGAVAGLVSITPGCNIVTPGWALVLGVIAGGVCAITVNLKVGSGFNDSLDVVGIHLVGGIIGMLFIGVFGSGIGIIYTSSPDQLAAQAIAAFGILAYSFVATWVIGTIIQKTIGFRISTDGEAAGVDSIIHARAAEVLVDD